MSTIELHGCDLPFHYEIGTIQGSEEGHFWWVVGAAGSVALSAIRLIDLNFELMTATRDVDGAQWLGASLGFHGVVPLHGRQPVGPTCHYLADVCGCYLTDSTLRAMGLMKIVIKFSPGVDRDLAIRRILTREYFEYEDLLTGASYASDRNGFS